jgi:hypothetical protein
MKTESNRCRISGARDGEGRMDSGYVEAFLEFDLEGAFSTNLCRATPPGGRVVAGDDLGQLLARVLPLSTLSPWYHLAPSAAIAIRRCPTIRGRRASLCSHARSSAQSPERTFPSARQRNTRPRLPVTGAWRRYAGSNTSSAARPACLRADSFGLEDRQSVCCKEILRACRTMVQS